MTDDIRWLVEIQRELANCRELAAQTPVPEAGTLLVQLTETIEALAHEIDLDPPLDPPR